MVSTRHHTRPYPPPDLSPSKQTHTTTTSTGSPVKRSSRSTSVATAGNDDSEYNGETMVAKRSGSPSKRGSGRPRARTTSAWSHTPSTLTLLWLAVSLPLVMWDIGYILGRPHTMPGGKWHSPLYTLYELYGTIDHYYGWPAWERRDGFSGAQTMLNVVETLLYLGYLAVMMKYGVHETGKRGTGAPTSTFGRRKLVGRDAGWAVLLGFAASVMTLSKTVLYWLVCYNNGEAGWEGLRHNDWNTLVSLWIIPNGLWVVLPTYMTYVFGKEILDGLEQAAGLPRRKDE